MVVFYNAEKVRSWKLNDMVEDTFVYIASWNQLLLKLALYLSHNAGDALLRLAHSKEGVKVFPQSAKLWLEQLSKAKDLKYV